MEDQQIQPTQRFSTPLKETFQVVLFLLVLLVFYFWRVIFGGEVFVPTDMIFSFPFFQDAAPDNFEQPSNALLSDAVLKFYPWHTVTWKAWQEGDFPFWNPYIYSGTPLFANAESAVLYPVNLIGNLLPHTAFFTFSAIMRMLIAGLGTFWFVRSLGAGRYGALLASVVFMFSGSMVVWLNYPVGGAYAWLPLLFFLGEQTIRQQRLIFVPLIALVLGTQILAGHHQTTFITLAGWSLYCAFRLWQTFKQTRDRKTVMWQTFLLGSGLAIGVLLVAIQLLPFLAWLQQTNEVQYRAAARSTSLIEWNFIKHAIIAAVTILLPNLFGNPTWGSPSSFFYSNYLEETIYVGIIPLVLVSTAVFTAWKNRENNWSKEQSWLRQLVLFMAILSILFLGLAMRLPGLDLINQLPIFNVIAPGRYRLIFTFFLTVLAGLGVEPLWAILISQRNGRRIVFVGALAFSVAGTLIILIIQWALSQFVVQLQQFGRLQSLYPILVDAFRLNNLEMIFPLLIALGLATWLVFWRRQSLSPMLMRGGFLFLIIVDLFLFGRSFNPSLPQDDVFPETPATQFLQQTISDEGPKRILALRDDLPANTATPYGLADVAGSDFPSARYVTFTTAMGGELYGTNRIYFADVHPYLLDLTGTRYLISSQPLNKEIGDNLIPVYQEEAFTIYENADALPYAQMVFEVEVVEDDAAALKHLLDGSFDPHQVVLLAEELPADYATATNALSSQAATVALDITTQKTTVHVNTPRAGFLVINEAFYPGWQAWRDGQELKIYRANYAFRAVYLPSGEHTIQFTYTPLGFISGLRLSLVGCFLILGLLFVDLLRHRSSRTP